jgi:16S rRNA (guanine966-N2)-methyltransferase
MRIIAGELRGRRIEAPAGMDTRPMLDRVREALFGRLSERLVDARVLDLFAGSGSLGIEALSRGAARARFVESGARALAALKSNIELLRLGKRAEVVRANALDPKCWRGKDEAAPLHDLVFFDPPYPLVVDPAERKKLVDALAKLFDTALVPEALLVFHLPAREAEVLRLAEPWKLESRVYGTSGLVFVQRSAE